MVSRVVKHVIDRIRHTIGVPDDAQPAQRSEPGSVDRDDAISPGMRAVPFHCARCGDFGPTPSAVREGNVLRIWIKDEDGRTLIEIPELLGVRGGARMLPVWAAVGALASVSGKLTVEVKREAAWPRYAE